MTHGAYAEYVCVEERFTVSWPEALSAQQGAALFVNGQTAYHALVTMGQAKPGESVLITAAAGGVGVCAVQLPNCSERRSSQQPAAELSWNL